MFRREAEMASAKARRSLQGQRLHDLVHRLTHSPAPFWRDWLSDVDARSIREPDDVRALPVMTPEVINSASPWERLTVPREMTVRATITHSPTPHVLATTFQDLRTATELAARALVCVGGRADDIVYIAPNDATFAYERGAELFGATVIAPAAHELAPFIAAHRAFGIHGLIGDYPTLSEILAQPQGDGFRYVVITSGRADMPTASSLAGLQSPDTIVRRTLDALDTAGPAIGIECGAASGTFHLFDDHILVEVLAQDTDRARGTGAVGELVVTTLTTEAMPVVRLRTGIQVALVREPCPCGRTHMRVKLAADST